MYIVQCTWRVRNTKPKKVYKKSLFSRKMQYFVGLSLLISLWHATSVFDNMEKRRLVWYVLGESM